MTAPTHLPCPFCEKPVKVIRQPAQRAARMADHGPKVTQLCPGAGMAVKNAVDESSPI